MPCQKEASNNLRFEALVKDTARTEAIAQEYRVMGKEEIIEDTMDGTLACMRGFAKCIDGYYEQGVLYGKGVEEKGAVLNRPELMQIAYEMGLSVHE